MMRLCLKFLIPSNNRRFMCSGYLGKIVTINDALSHWTNVFKNHKVPEPVRSIELILTHVTDKKKVGSLYDAKYDLLTPEQYEYTNECCQARLARMPVQYIIKDWDFRDLTLAMSPPVFIPRPETEELVEFISDYIKKENLRPSDLLEIGCGTGAIMLSLLKELTYNITAAVAIDRSNEACSLARDNAKLVKEDRITIINAELQEDGTITCVSNKTNPFQFSRFDIIVSNPPYVPTKDLRGVEPEIKLYEDLRALDGGPDGLNVIKPLIIYSSFTLKPSGSLFIEIDETHPKLIMKWIETNFDRYKLKVVKVKKDFAGKDRFVHIMRG